MTNADELIQALRDLEPVVAQAGQWAKEQQPGIKWNRKQNTGNLGMDIVTEADLEVERRLLAALLETPLRECTLFTEEQTDQATQFSGQAPFVLSIDPIDSTGTYAKGGHFYSVVVTLHDGKQMLYSCKYYPAFDGWLRIVGDTIEAEPNWPTIELDHPELAQDTVVWISKPEDSHFLAAQKQAADHKLTLRRTSEVIKQMSTSSLYLMGKVPGYLCGVPNAYDGLTVLHFAQARGDLILSSDGSDGSFRINETYASETGRRYPGYYLVINKDFHG